jgi:hypothetical protein
MKTTVEKDLKSLLSYYGENPESSDAPKPEDFFGLVASFSSSLQVSYPKVIPFRGYFKVVSFRNAVLRYMMPRLRKPSLSIRSHLLRVTAPNRSAVLHKNSIIITHRGCRNSRISRWQLLI